MNTKGSLFFVFFLTLCTDIFAQKIADGYSHFLAVCNDSTVMAWGSNQSGQLGLGDTSNRQNPTPVSGLTGVIAVAASSNSSFALKVDGTIWAWGDNSAGQLGDGTTIEKHTPVQITGLTGVIAISGGSNSGPMALKSDSTVWYWGGITGSHVPIQVNGLTGIIAMTSSGVSWLALKRDGTLWAWGNNSYGQLGIGTSSSTTLTPVQVHAPNNIGLLTGITAIKGGNEYFIALKNDSTVFAWGYNYYGQLGNNTTKDTSLPVKVDSLFGIKAIGTGSYHSLAAKSDGSVWAWGYDYAGQGGGYTPGKVYSSSGSFSNIIEVTGGYWSTSALKNDGTLWEWGAYEFFPSNFPYDTPNPFEVIGLCNLSGIEQLSTNNYLLSVYPNPSSGIFNLKIDQFDPSITNTIEIYNAFGDIVYLKKNNGNNLIGINITYFDEGVYYYKVSNEKTFQTNTGKIILLK